MVSTAKWENRAQIFVPRTPSRKHGKTCMACQIKRREMKLRRKGNARLVIHRLIITIHAIMNELYLFHSMIPPHYRAAHAREPEK